MFSSQYSGNTASPYSSNPLNSWDVEAASEAAQSYNAFSALGIISDPQAFARICECYDFLLGRKKMRIDPSAIISDQHRRWYLLHTAYILRQSKLEIGEYARVCDKVRKYVESNNKGKHRGMSPDSMTLLIWRFCQHIDFEPKWHQRRRGDDRPLPTDRGKNLWRYLRDMYIDPEKSRLRMPDTIKRIAPMYKGYEDCVRAAVSEGHAELKRRYGNDTDLSPITEIRDQQDDYDGTSFMRIMASGNPFANRLGASNAKKEQ